MMKMAKDEICEDCLKAFMTSLEVLDGAKSCGWCIERLKFPSPSKAECSKCGKVDKIYSLFSEATMIRILMSAHPGHKELQPPKVQIEHTNIE